MIEFDDNSLSSFHGRGFGRVMGVMVHDQMTFLVLSWIVHTGRVHPKLNLHEFIEAPLFQYPPFKPLTILDHQRFVNKVYFAKLESRLYLNE